MNEFDRMFRQHDVAPAGVTSPLYRQLTQEWAALHALPNTASKVRRWARTEPVLTGFTRPGDIVDAIDTADHDRRNDLLAALIRLFQAGQQLAGRTVLQALLPKLAKMRTSVWDPDLESVEERQHITIAEFWAVMSHYPLQRRPKSVSGGLVLDTLNRVTVGHYATLKKNSVIRLNGVDLDHLRLAEATRASRDHESHNLELTSDADLTQVVIWGVRAKVITRDEANLLITAYLPEPDTTGFAQAATQLGLTQAAVRQRCSRAARKLTHAVRAEMAGDHIPLPQASVA